MKTKVEIIKTSGLLSAILQLQRAIQLGENLQNRGIVVEIGYLRCKEVKSPMHTYFHCDFFPQSMEVCTLGAVHIAAEDTFESSLVKF